AEAIANGAAMAAPVHEGRRGHPVGFARRYRDALRGLTGDEGARGIIGTGLEFLARITVDDPGILRDVDVRDPLAFPRGGAA
ncbi:MAG: NTP transferase domain-containing protein, partial [Casimicrobiaceae bacterium]